MQSTQGMSTQETPNTLHQSKQIHQIKLSKATTTINTAKHSPSYKPRIKSKHSTLNPVALQLTILIKYKIVHMQIHLKAH